MENVTIGNTDYRVSRMGLGCMSMSGCYGAQDDVECVRTIHRAAKFAFVEFLLGEADLLGDLQQWIQRLLDHPIALSLKNSTWIMSKYLPLPEQRASMKPAAAIAHPSSVDIA